MSVMPETNLNDQLQELLDASAAQWEAVAKQWNESLRSIDWESVASAMQELGQALPKIEAIGRCGWTVPFTVGLHDIRKFAATIADEKSADVIFVEYFTRDGQYNLTRLLEGLVGNMALQPMMPAIETAVRMLRLREYRACIALLVPLVEGTCAARFGQTGFNQPKQRNKYFEERIEQAGQDSILGLQWRGFKGFCDGLFGFHNFADPTFPPRLNRHWLAHGRMIPDDSLADSIRLLQALRTVIDLW